MLIQSTKILALFFIISTSANAEITNKIEFLNYNSGNGKIWAGWEHSIDVTSYNDEGWLLDTVDNLGNRDSYLWGKGPRTFNKADYGKNNTAIIDTSFPTLFPQRGSFKVYEYNQTDDTDNRSTWWVWYDGKPLSERGITDSKTNRMSFYIYIDGMDPINDTGGNSVATNFHVGTYLCWYGTEPAYGRGDGCPYEGVGNQHYYHYFSFNPGAWIHVLMDQHPTHRRSLSGSASVPNNPTYSSDGKNYFEHLNQFYMEIRNDNLDETAYWLDEIEFYEENEPQNDESITSLWIGYWKSEGYFEIGFQDASFTGYNDTSNSSFEIRWSNQPITNQNFSSANIITPIFYAGSEYSGNDHIFRRPSSYYKSAWTRFKIAGAMPDTLSEIYVAVKDVSSLSNNTGTKYPWNRGDGHDAPSHNIKTINLLLRNKLLPPKNLTIK